MCHLPSYPSRCDEQLFDTFFLNVVVVTLLGSVYLIPGLSADKDWSLAGLFLVAGGFSDTVQNTTLKFHFHS